MIKKEKKQINPQNIQLVQDAMIRIIKNRGGKYGSFWGCFLAHIDCVYTESSIETAAIGVSRYSKKITLYVNPDFFEGKSYEFQDQVIIHECEHVIKGHILDMNSKNKNHKIYNIACDVQINEKLPALQEFGYTSDKLNLPKNLTSENYYDILYKNYESILDLINKILKDGKLGDHSSWEEFDSGPFAEAVVKDVLEKTISELKNKSDVPRRCINNS